MNQACYLCVNLYLQRDELFPQTQLTIKSLTELHSISKGKLECKNKLLSSLISEYIIWCLMGRKILKQNECHGKCQNVPLNSSPPQIQCHGTMSHPSQGEDPPHLSVKLIITDRIFKK